MIPDLKDEIKEAIDKVFERHESALHKLIHEINMSDSHPSAIIVHPVFMDKLLSEVAVNCYLIFETGNGLAGYTYKRYKRSESIPIYVSSNNLKHNEIKIL